MKSQLQSLPIGRGEITTARARKKKTEQIEERRAWQSNGIGKHNLRYVSHFIVQHHITQIVQNTTQMPPPSTQNEDAICSLLRSTPSSIEDFHTHKLPFLPQTTPTHSSKQLILPTIIHF
eukprot:c12439_g1_i1 orf=166-525(-)